MKFGLKWVHMTRYGLILKLDGALWLTIIFKPLLTPKGAIKIPKNPKKVLKSVPNQPRYAPLVVAHIHKAEDPDKSLARWVVEGATVGVAVLGGPKGSLRCYYLLPHLGWIAARAHTG